MYEMWVGSVTAENPRGAHGQWRHLWHRSRCAPYWAAVGRICVNILHLSSLKIGHIKLESPI